MFCAWQQKGGREKEDLNQTAIDLNTDRLMSEVILSGEKKANHRQEAFQYKDLMDNKRIWLDPCDI